MNNKDQRFLYQIEKEGTGTLNIRSSDVVNLEEANKLNWIFENYSGKVQDFALYFDEFSTEKVPLSHCMNRCTALAPLEITILKKHGLTRTGVVTPLDLLEEFEAMMGDLQFDEGNGVFYLPGDEVYDEEGFLEDEEMVEVIREGSGPKGSIII